MKRVITILLALVMALSLAACGGGEEAAETRASENLGSSKNSASDLEAVKKAVIGLWLGNDDGLYKGYIFREDGTVYYKSQLGGTGITQELNGTFMVTEDGIELINDAGNTKTLTYTYNDGKLKVFDGDLELLFDEG